jgi:glycosyltransferase involved in cell wall biosynthesis
MKLPFYKSATLLLSTGLSVRVLWYLWKQRPDVIHVSTPGILCFAAVLYARLFAVPLVMSYHTHIPEYIPRYTWKGLVAPMWSIIRWCTRRADLTLVTSAAMKVGEGRVGRWAGAQGGGVKVGEQEQPWCVRVRPDFLRAHDATPLDLQLCRAAARPGASVWLCLALMHAGMLYFLMSPIPSNPLNPSGIRPDPRTHQSELEKNKCRPKSIDVWLRGVDTEVFHPRHRSEEMRLRMTEGHPEAPLLVYVGRLGAGDCALTAFDRAPAVSSCRVRLYVCLGHPCRRKRALPAGL